MSAFHDYLFSLICTSLIISVASTSFSALTITLSPVLWLIPAVVIMTFIYHTFVLLIAHSETYTTPRIHSASSIVCAYLLTSLWVAVFVTSVTFTCLVISKKWAISDKKMNIFLILLSVLSFIEIMIMGLITILSHKELRLRQYKRKWEWKNVGPAGWSTFVQLPA